MKFPHARIVQFAKRPLAGHVKTRLIPAIGAQGAYELYQKLLRHTWQTLSSAHVATMELWVDSAEPSPFFDTLKPAVASVVIQQGLDLGERMGNAVEQVLKRSNAVVIVGSDCPVLDGDYVTQALQSLLDGADVVLGPANDGGYVLIAMRRYLPQVFDDIDWGSDQVLEQTRVRLRAINCPWHELTPLWDVDRPDDLDRLKRLALF